MAGANVSEDVKFTTHTRDSATGWDYPTCRKMKPALDKPGFVAGHMRQLFHELRNNMWERLLSIILLAGALAIQGLASSICATIALPDGQPLRRATLKVVNLDEPSIQQSAPTDSNGKACIPHLVEGLYSVEASAGGFIDAKYYPVRVAFPDDLNFSFRLPFGEISEGLGLVESTLSGTLLDNGKPFDGVKICLFEGGKPWPSACAVTNDLGQYAMTVPPAIYRVVLTRLMQTVHETTIDLSQPGYYRSRVSPTASAAQLSQRK